MGADRAEGRLLAASFVPAGRAMDGHCGGVHCGR